MQTHLIKEEETHIDLVKRHFDEDNVITSKEIAELFRGVEPELKKATINWRVFDLVKKGILERIGRGVFTLGQKRIFKPSFSKAGRTIATLIHSKFPYSELCVWNTSVINEFMLHQPFRHIEIVEMDKDSVSAVFILLKEHGYNAFLKPGQETMKNYVWDTENPVIIKPLVTEAPIQEVDSVSTITLEKLIVDLVSEPILFQSYQGKELEIILDNVFDNYTINLSKLKRYADRRKQRSSMYELLSKRSNVFKAINFGPHD